VSPSSAKRAPAPKRVRLRAYEVGFGDAFLLSFEYAKKVDGRASRHVLIDFGSTRWPGKERKPPSYAEIAADIAKRTGGKLDVVVLTHRHKDHLSGFADPEAGQTIAELEPSLVLRPWTEDPKLRSDASGPAGVDDALKRFAANLNRAGKFAEEVHRGLDGRGGYRGSLAALAADQVPNKAAIERLDELADNADLKGRYLYAGQDSGIEEAIPGIEVAVLGPPTPKQWPEVTGQRDDDPEYWLQPRALLKNMLAEARQIETAAVEGLGLPDTDGHLPPGPERWLVERMRDQQVHSLLRIVRTLDDALNNTSLILLFSVGSRRLLFPGDAQIENWSYVLKDKRGQLLGGELPNVDLYKVGHHGSRNASPRSLLEMWESREKASLTSVMSTMPKVHGKTEATAVPRATLIKALEELGALRRTDELEPNSLYLELSGSTSKQGAFAVKHGARAEPKHEP
jgi:hypothetical protein